MSYVVNTGGGDRYRGGYASGPGLKPDELRVATSTFENYIEGTIALVFLVLACFLFLTFLSFLLMCYARYMNTRQPKTGFYNPPPMLTRYPRKRNGGTGTAGYGSTVSRSDYSTLQTRHGAQSQQSEML